MAASTDKKKILLIILAGVVATIGAAALYTVAMEEEVPLPPAQEVPAVEADVGASAAELPVEANNTEAGVPSAPLDSDAAPSKETVVTIGEEAGFIVANVGGTVPKERADQILASFSKKAQKAAEKKTTSAKAGEAEMLPPPLGFDSQRGSRNVLTRGGTPTVVAEGSGIMPVFSSGQGQNFAVPGMPVPPQQEEIKINGVICSGGGCSAMTNKGTIRAGMDIAGEKIVAIDKSGIKTSKRFIAY